MTASDQPYQYTFTVFTPTYNRADTDLFEIAYKYQVRGEKWSAQRTDVLKQFPLPVIPGYRSYVPEGLSCMAIAEKFRAIFANEALRIYWYNARPDQITNRSLPSKSAIGMVLWHQCVLNQHIKWFRYAPEEFLRSAVHYARFSFHAGKGALAQLKQLDNALAKGLWAMMLPVGFVVYCKDMTIMSTYL